MSVCLPGWVFGFFLEIVSTTMHLNTDVPGELYIYADHLITIMGKMLRRWFP